MRRQPNRVLAAILLCVVAIGTAASCGPRPPAEVRAKAQRVRAGVEEWKREGRNPIAVAMIVKDVRPLIKDGRFGEAEARLDDALATLAGEGPPPKFTDPSGARLAARPFRPLVLRGEQGGPKVRGFYDPSIAYDEAGDVGWMTYSKVIEPGAVDTHLAVTRDHGKTWTFVKALNVSEYTTIAPDGDPIEGVWRHEVSTIVHDPGDRGREWKVFWHHYFARKPYHGKNRMFMFGWIAYRTASDPAGTWSEAVPLLRGKLPKPEQFRVAHSLVDLSDDLRRVPTYTEPGAMVHDGVLYLALSVGHPKKRGNILIASRDHGKSWSYRGYLTRKRDSDDLGFFNLTAPALVSSGDRAFLLASPSGPFGPGKAYQGAIAAEIVDLATASLARDADGRLTVLRRIGRDSEEVLHWGVPGYDPANRAGGIVVGQIRQRSGRPDYALYDTGELLP